MKLSEIKYQGVATLGVNLNRQKYGPLDVSSVLLTLADLNWYIQGSADNAPSGWTGGTPYPYPGQLIVVLENNTVYQLYADETSEVVYRPLIDLSSFYTKEETNEIISNISVDLTDYYTKTEVDALLESIQPPQIDLSNYYTKEQIDDIVGSIEGAEGSVAMAAMTQEEILTAIGAASGGAPVTPSGQVLTEMSADDVRKIINT